MNFFRLLATLAARQKPFIINGSVGFTTFVVGDVLSQGARPLPGPPTPTAVGITPAIQHKPSWQQLIADRTRGVDFRRSVKVGLLGVVTNGFFLGAWYRVLDRYLGADRSNIQSVLKKCVADQIVYAPFSITTFVGYAAVLNGDGMRNVAQETVNNLRETFWSTWLMDCRVWPVANLVMFRLIPSSYRPSFASVVQVAWQTYLSSVSYDRPKHSAIQALSEGKPASVRGGAVKDRTGELPVPLPQIQSPAAVAHSLEHQRVTMADRRQTGRYAEGARVSDALSTATSRRGNFRNPGKAYLGAVSLEGAEGAPRSKSKES